MSLLLCRQETVKHPFYAEELGVHIYSSQELSYIIYNNPLMAMDGFVDECLITFIRQELDMEFLAARLEKWIGSRENTDELLFIILQECSYYTAAEINQFHQKTAAFRKLHQAEYAKQRADFLFERKQYGKAAVLYERILELPKDRYVDDLFLGKVWNNLGSAYARIFHFEKASQAFDRAYTLTRDLTILQKIYYLSAMDGGIELKERYQPLIGEDIKKQWDDRRSEVRDQAKTSQAVLKLEELFQKDPIKRIAGAGGIIHRWKQDYRSMV